MAKKKVMGAAALTAAIAGGGALGMLLGSPVASGAQTEESTTTTAAPEEPTTTTAPESTAPDTTAPDCDRGPGFGRHRGVGLDLAVAADALGITEDELRTELESGSSIADVAGERGVDVQTVIDALVADATADIDERVAAGDLTAERADELKANLAERVTDFVDRDGPLRPGGHGPDGPDGPGARGRPGWGR
jgi:hypothetical protein